MEAVRDDGSWGHHTVPIRRPRGPNPVPSSGVAHAHRSSAPVVADSRTSFRRIRQSFRRLFQDHFSARKRSITGDLRCVLDSNFHRTTEFMKSFGIFRRTTLLHSRDEESQIRVYRSHAARAISEERWEVAEIFLDRILNVDPHHTEAWLMKGHLRHHCREDEQTAVDCYRKVLNLCDQEPAHPHARRARTSLSRLLAVWG